MEQQPPELPTEQLPAEAPIAGDQLPATLSQPVAQMAAAERKLASEDIVVAAPMSFAGSAQRIWKLTKFSDNQWAMIAFGTLAVTLIAFAWMFVLAWYVLFGLLLVPYRLVRRGQRKRKLEGARHQEMLDATRQR